MNNVRLTTMAIRTGILSASLCLSMSSMSFGELAAPGPVNTNTAQAESLDQQNESSERAIPSEYMGFRSAESEGEPTVVPLAPLQRSLSAREPELVETTDASGGTMIQLQGKFQCGLKVTQESMDKVVEPSMAPNIP